MYAFAFRGVLGRVVNDGVAWWIVEACCTFIEVFCQDLDPPRLPFPSFADSRATKLSFTASTQPSALRTHVRGSCMQ